jgi:methionine-rich copper-binding protein CopC
LTSLARAIVASAVVVLPTPGLAHSLLVESTPAAKAVLSASPRHADLRFNNRIERRLSSIVVVGPDGRRHPGTVVADTAADRLRAALPPLPPGDYRLEWRVLSADGHVVTGSYPFRVR